MSMDKVKWGMIGCGDVTEVKSGPAFNKAQGSELLAVMARNEDKVKDYAMRHGVPAYYTNLVDFLNHPGINAVYIATPPATHLQFALEAFKAGKNVYVEKPMTLNANEAIALNESAEAHGCKLVVAPYRRAQPMFTTIKELLDKGKIGQPLYARLDFRRHQLNEKDLQVPKTAWRIDPSQSGGGLFHDMAPHQVGLLYYFFGEIKEARGFSARRSIGYHADDLVTGMIKFQNGVHFTGNWNFSSFDEVDDLSIFGTNGSLSFPVFDRQELNIKTLDGDEKISFEKIEHVQQPLIEKAVQYFSGNASNPCPAAEGIAVMNVLDAFTKR